MAAMAGGVGHNGRGRARWTWITATAVMAAAWLPSPASSDASAHVVRVAGGDRYQTAANVQLAAYTSADTVVVASGQNFPDALGAARLGFPILLTERDALPKPTEDALRTLGTKAVDLVGGVGVISEAVAARLRDDLGLAVRRIAGADRYETSRRIAEAAGPAGDFQGQNTAIVVTGTDFADALSAGPLSFARQFPIVLTTPDQLHPHASALLSEQDITFALVGGGPGAVSDHVVNQLKDMGIQVQRVAGRDRAETAANGAELASQVNSSAAAVYLVTGRTFPDGLATAPYAGNLNDGGPILIADGWPSSSAGYVQRHQSQIKTVYVIGGTGAVSAADAAAACRDAGGTNC